MGLRRQMIGYVIAVSAGCVLLGVWALQRGLEQAYHAAELEEARDDFRHLLAVLDGEIQHREAMLREWRLWPDLRRHLQRPDPAFGARSFDPVYLNQIGLEGLMLLDAQGRVALQAWASPDGERWAATLPPGSRAWIASPAADAPACGLIGSPDYLVLLCRRALAEPGLKDGVQGVLVMAERLDSHFLRTLERRAGLPVRFVPAAQAQPLAGDIVEPLASAELPGAGPWSLRHLDEHLLMHWPLPMAGEPAQQVALEVLHGREVARRGAQELHERRLVMVLLGVLLSVGLGVLLDRLVISRVVRMRRELAGIREQRQWHAAVTLQGADEINELGAGINHLLSVIDRQVYELEKLSMTDALTGLPNRRLLMDRLQHATAAVARSGTQGALLFIDLDNFKDLNDTLGHDTGDQLLMQVAQRLKGCVRESDTVARFGGDEFVVLVDAPANRAHIAAIAEKLLQALQQDIAWQGHTLQVGASIGISCFPDDGQTVQEMLAHADRAMYRVKAAGRNTYLFFTA